MQVIYNAVKNKWQVVDIYSAYSTNVLGDFDSKVSADRYMQMLAAA